MFVGVRVFEFGNHKEHLNMYFVGNGLSYFSTVCTLMCADSCSKQVQLLFLLGSAPKLHSAWHMF